MKPDDVRFTPDALLQQLASLPRTTRYWVGLSGGADSTALLMAMHALRNRLPAALHAVHFNHGLQTAANSWQAACERICADRGIPLRVLHFNLQVRDGQSPELQARAARYDAVASLLDPEDVYLTAHHADDNAETVLLHLMRGSGVDGLAGIPPLRKVGRGWVARPLLGFRRRDLEAYLEQQGVQWQQDASNQDSKLDRGFLRNELLPMLAHRWPALVSQLHRSAGHARETMKVLGYLLESQYGSFFEDGFLFPLTPLLQLSSEVQVAALRHWMKRQDITPPPGRRMTDFLDQLKVTAHFVGGHKSANGGGRTSHAELRWANHLLKRHGDFLWLQELPLPGPCPRLAWSNGPTMSLGTDFGDLVMAGPDGRLPGDWHIGPRKNGARMQLHAQGPRRSLKSLLRESGIPPWLREAVPVLYWKDEPASIGDWLMSPELRQFLAEQGAHLEWRPNLPLLQKLQSVSVLLLTRKDVSHEQEIG